MKRTRLWQWWSGIVVWTMALCLVGFSLPDDEEAFFQLGGTIDIHEDQLVYTVDSPELKQSGIYMFDLETKEVVQLTEEAPSEQHTQPVVSADGTQMAYLVTTQGNENEPPASLIELMHLESKQVRTITARDVLVTSIAFAPESDVLYYSKAKTFDNYSPIAKKAPHDLNIFRYSLGEKTHTQMTDENHYSMSDLSVSLDGSELYFSTFDGTAQSLMKVETEAPSTQTRIAPIDKKDIYSPEFSPNGELVAFTRPANLGENDPLYEYELFTMDMDTRQVEQRTSLGTNVHELVFANDDAYVYFVENKGFGSYEPRFAYYRYDLENNQLEPIDINSHMSTGSRI
ncbi:hypothetical protein G4V62_02570 [Bacillaceae bacterium SIJ1]|uniref:TolB family protein n=1 Tax=Litoribacterium kuwaitense TaxID=1398745 RepID=UPI0013EDCBFB|nr:hypothetical protein [Litoribacterium kuwaitense]NGP43884.1 hypothetical protein [Litoribacterium kuwaitense]